MPEKKFSHIRLTSQSIKGNYFGAYDGPSEDDKQGYTLFISHTPDAKDYCECRGYVHGKLCYHLKDAQKLEEFLGVTDLSDAQKKRERETK